MKIKPCIDSFDTFLNCYLKNFLTSGSDLYLSSEHNNFVDVDSGANNFVLVFCSSNLKSRKLKKFHAKLISA